MRLTVGLWGDLGDSLEEETVFESSGFWQTELCSAYQWKAVQTVCVQDVRALQEWYLSGS